MFFNDLKYIPGMSRDTATLLIALGKSPIVEVEVKTGGDGTSPAVTTTKIYD